MLERWVGVSSSDTLETRHYLCASSAVYSAVYSVPCTVYVYDDFDFAALQNE